MLGEQALTVQRAGVPVLTAGEWIAPDPTEVPITGTLLPLSERNREHVLRLPEGWRNAARFVLFTTAELVTLSVQAGTVADRITYQGRGLLVSGEADYSATLTPGMSLQHRRYILLDEEVTPI